MPAQIRFQPTLFVFLGTSSGQVYWRLKKLLRQAYGNVPVLRFLWVDIDTAVDPQARPWLASGERVELAGFNPAAVVRNLDHYPTIKEWFPEVSVPAGMLAGGGAPQQMRLIGRAALFRMFNDRARGEAFIDRLRQEVEALFEIENIEATEARSDGEKIFSVEPGCRVVIVLNNGGGSGSAMAFDVAYLCRDLLAGKNPTIINISLLPPVVDKAIRSETQGQKEKIRANAYAWFREDHALSLKPYWNVQYPEGAPVEVHAPPFDYRFIVDIENQAGYRLNSAEDVYNMVAQAIFMDTGSSIAGAMRGFTANVFALSEEFEGMRRSFSSLAAASLVYPKERLRGYCGSRLAAAFIQGGLLQEPDRHHANVAASTLLARLRLRDGDLLAELTGLCPINQAAEPVIVKADSVAGAAAQVDAQEAQNQAARRAEAEKMQRYAAEKLEDLKARIDAEITALVGVGGLRFAAAVAGCLLEPAPAGLADPAATSLDGLKNRVLQQGCTEADLAGARAGLEKSRGALKSLDDGVEDALERLVSMKGWKRKFALFKRDCLAAMAQVNDLAMLLAAQGLAVGLYDQLASHLDGLRARLEAAAAKMSLAAEALRLQAEEAGRPAAARAGGYEFLQEVAVDFDGFYWESAAPIAPQAVFAGMLPAGALASAQALEEWAAGGAREDAFRYAAGFFHERLEGTSLLSTLRDMAARLGREPAALVEEHLNRLVGYCHPFWRYDQDCGLNDTEGKSIIGVEDENSPLLPASYRNGALYEIKTTGFRDRIDVVRVRHGLPAFLIRGMAEWRAVYERRRRGADPLHVLPGMEFAPDLLPERDAKNRDAFAAALAFGYIVQVGSWYYYDPEKRYSTDGILPGKEFRLAQGREKAGESFARREEWARAVSERIEQEVRQIGNETAIRRLDAVMDACRADIARMKSPDEALRRQFERELQALLNMQRALGKVG